MNDITRILRSIQQGEAQAPEQLLPLVYEELRKLAAQRLSHESPGQTLQPTALVHEAYLRLVDVAQPAEWNGRGHFFAAAAEAMRRILVEKARRRKRLRHGGDHRRLELDRLDSQLLITSDDGDDDKGSVEELLALDEALDRLAAQDAQTAQVVKLRYFAGLTIEQTADVMGISERTANRHWAYAKAWLYQQLSERRDAAG